MASCVGADQKTSTGGRAALCQQVGLRAAEKFSCVFRDFCHGVFHQLCHRIFSEALESLTGDEA